MSRATPDIPSRLKILGRGSLVERMTLSLDFQMIEKDNRANMLKRAKKF